MKATLCRLNWVNIVKWFDGAETRDTKEINRLVPNVPMTPPKWFEKVEVEIFDYQTFLDAHLAVCEFPYEERYAQ